MKIIVLLVFILSFATGQQTYNCTPGQFFYVQCNLCQCSNGQFVCTTYQCPPGQYDSQGNLISQQQNRPQQGQQQSFQPIYQQNFQPGGQQGTSLNTVQTRPQNVPQQNFQPAIPNQQPVFQQNIQPSPQQNNPPTILQNIIQTRPQNGPQQQQRPQQIPVVQQNAQPQAVNCVPGTRYRKDCNSCLCGSDGFSEICTQQSCSNANSFLLSVQPLKGSSSICNNQYPLYQHGTPCIPQQRFCSRCNECLCLRSGRGALCTLNSC